MGTKTLLQTHPLICFIAIHDLLLMFPRCSQVIWCPVDARLLRICDRKNSLGWAWAFGIEGCRVHIHQQYPCLTKLLGHHYPENIQGSFSMLINLNLFYIYICIYRHQVGVLWTELAATCFLLCPWQSDSKTLIVTEELSISSLKTK